MIGSNTKTTHLYIWLPLPFPFPPAFPLDGETGGTDLSGAEETVSIRSYPYCHFPFAVYPRSFPFPVPLGWPKLYI